MKSALLRQLCAAAAIALTATALTAPVSRAAGGDPEEYVLSDVRVLYVADDIESIDWPVLYYLNNDFGCRIDIAVLREREGYRAEGASIPDREMYFHAFYLPPDEPKYIDSVAAALFSNRYPDIAIFSASAGGTVDQEFRAWVSAFEPSPERTFNIEKIYQEGGGRTPVTDSLGAVVLNGRELAHRYEDRLRAEVPLLVGRSYRPTGSTPHLTHYILTQSRVADRLPDIEFLGGIQTNRLIPVIEELLPRGPKQLTLLRQAREFLSSLRGAENLEGRRRVEAVVTGYRSLYDLVNATNDDPMLDSRTDLRFYTGDLLHRTEQLALTSAGVAWEGRVFLRDSPHGTRLKFRATLSADGPRQITLSGITFHPYWDTTAIPIDTATYTIEPHQTFVREYLVDVNEQYFSARQPESLVFTAQINYGTLPMTVRNALAVYQRTDLQVAFEPDFYFVPPVANLNIDRVVSPMTLRVIISKPPSFAGTVKLSLVTPRGLYAGAYRQELTLDKGKTSETVRIPFSISKLFELGLQHQTISLEYDGKTVSADTALVRIASCKIDDKVQIAFLPDTSGLLEDILNMTDATFRPLTDRGLETASLDAYDVIVIGSGAFRSYPSFRKMKDRFEEFMRNGGSLVIMGQPDDWPEGVLPVSFVPGVELVDKQEITNRINRANVLTRPYEIVETNLLSSFYKRREVASAAIAPAEKVFVTPTGGSLLSVSRIGDGQLIYCGLPLLDMISRLDIDAIHLLANILNY